jgi:hypothetical protein
MSLRVKVFSLFAFTAFAAYANLLTFSLTGQQLPISAGGGNCSPPSPTCALVGDASDYQIFSMTLTELTNTASGSTWNLDVQTNYPGGTFPPGSNPGTELQDIQYDGFAGNSFQTFPGYFNIGDLLIYSSTDGTFATASSLGGVVLSDHIGSGGTVTTTPGSLILNTNDLETSCFALTGNTTCSPISGMPRPNDPVWLLNGNQTSGFTTGTESEIAFSNASVPGTLPTGCTSGTQAEFTVCDNFSAPANFLSSAYLGGGTPLFDITSFVCDNGVLNGSSGVLGSGGVPEPRGLFLLIPGLLLAAYFVRRRYGLTA